MLDHPPVPFTARPGELVVREGLDDDGASRQAAIVAVRAVRAFEALVGRECGAEPVGARYLASPGSYVDAIEIANRHRDGMDSARDEAEEVARALADLLRAMGATTVCSYNMD